jgi:hypothetical protein
MSRKLNHQPIQPRDSFATALSGTLSIAVHFGPLLSKDLDEGATRGRLHSDLLDTTLLCPEAILSIQVQYRPTLPREVLCTEPRIGPRPRTSAQLPSITTDASSLRPTRHVGEAMKRP